MRILTVLLLLLLAVPAFADAEGPDIGKYLEEHPEAVLNVIKKHPVTMLKTVQEGSEIQRTRHMLRSFVEQKGKKKVPDATVDGHLIIGNPDAKVTILMFTDFTCHYCSKAIRSMARLVPQLSELVRLVFKAAPRGGDLGFKAFKALYAVMELDKEKAFPFALELFSDQDEFMHENEKFLDVIAERVGLDVTAFQKLREDTKFDKIVNEDIEECKRLGVNGTPAFFVNEIRLDGFLPDNLYKAAVDVAEGIDITIPEDK